MAAPLRFQHFEVLTRADGAPHLLGKGAMGLTYKAFDRNLLSLAVIKVISPQYAQHPAARQRFLQEAQSMAKIKHPNVADVFFLGDSPQGPFYAMEFCDGPSAQDYVEEKGPLDPTDAFTLVLQAASALQAVEQAGLIHRDIKPSNLLLVNDAQGRTVLKLIDFGLARDVLRESGAANLSHGGFVGTPTFASPEQLLEQEDLDIRSDIYSLGVTLWFLLSGRPPFSGSQFEVMFHHVNTPPPWDRMPAMPEPARTVLRQMVEKSPEDRIPSPAELYREMQAALASVGHSSVGGARLSISPREKDGSVLGMSAFEILAEAESDLTGKTFRARDTHSGQLVALKYLNPELAGKPALLAKLQRHVLSLRQLHHPNLIGVLDFEKGEDGVKIATEWVRGPNLLALLKARNELTLREAAPLLAQLASACDFGIANALATLETDLHQILLTSPTLGEDPSHWPKALRTPASSWQELAVKINPLRLSAAATDYPTLPEETRSRSSSVPDSGLARMAAANGGPRPLLTTYLGLVHRLLGGAGGSHASSHGGYVSIPHLGAEANDLLESFFVPPFTPEKRAATCAKVLRELCKAERVPEPPIFMPPAEVEADATRTRDSSVAMPAEASGSQGRPASVPGSSFVPMAPPSTHRDSRFPSTQGSQPGRPPTRYGSSTMGSSAGKITADYEIKRKELELQRQRLEAEAARLQQEELLEQTRMMLEEERSALATAKDEFARLERERAARAEQERQRLDHERQALEAHTSELERKRLEQERLEQEIQLRAQLEFQKFQEEKRRREEEWQRQRDEIERALREREEQYLLREQNSFRKLQEERKRLEDLAAEVEREKTRAQHEAETTARSQLAGLEAERQRLADEQAELQRRIIAQSHDHARLRQELENAERDLEERHRIQAAQLSQSAAQREADLESDRRRLAEERAALEGQREALRSEREAGVGATLLSSQQQDENEAALARLAAEEAQLAKEREELAAASAARERELAAAIDGQRQELEKERQQLFEEAQRSRSATAAEVETARAQLESQRQQLAAEEAQLVRVLDEKGRELEQQIAQQKRDIEDERTAVAQQRAALDAQQQRLVAQLDAERERFRRELEEQRAAEEADAARRAQERASELARLEGEQQAKLESLRSEISREEDRLAQQKAQVFSQERLQVRMDQEAGFQSEEEIEKIEAEQKRLEAERVELEARIAEYQQVQRAAQRRRLVTLAVGLILLLAAGSVGAYFSRGFIGELINPGFKLWNTYEQEMAHKEQAQDWRGLLKLVATTDAEFQKEPRFAQFYAAHSAELHDKAAAAAHHLHDAYQRGTPVPKDEDAEALLHELNAVATWVPDATEKVLSARVAMPLYTAKRSYIEALRVFIEVARTDAAAAASLKKEFDWTLAAQFEDLRARQTIEQPQDMLALLQELPASVRVSSPRVALLEGWLKAAEQRRDGNITLALQTLIDISKGNAPWTEELKPDAQALAESFRQRPPGEIRTASSTLIAAGRQWKLATPFMLLAQAEPEERQKYDFYLEAEKLGDITAKVEVGGHYYFGGRSRGDQATLDEGLARLKEAAAAGHPHALYLLADAYFEGPGPNGGVGVKENAVEAARLAQMALGKGHSEALRLLGNAQLRQAELDPSPAAYEAATRTLENAAAQNIKGAWFTLYISRWNATVQDASAALDALRSGAEAQDPNCLHVLGLWYLKGQPPLEKNLSLARDSMAKAATLGHDDALKWCRSYAAQVRDTGTPADKEWVERNRDAWQAP
ncbi:MAG: protein kinase domain-containing protein [Verrucomicrobiales bacterium]